MYSTKIKVHQKDFGTLEHLRTFKWRSKFESKLGSLHGGDVSAKHPFLCSTSNMFLNVLSTTISASVYFLVVYI